MKLYSCLWGLDLQVFRKLPPGKHFGRYLAFTVFFTVDSIVRTKRLCYSNLIMWSEWIQLMVLGLFEV
ncbi:hypothetical protein Pla144_42400 [Bythopirellula polymerisocia]|uniref:Uncharacterized protein n=1 Tax=Bythopirellula polymerisocia TaxID=2528003 RepID=A0A5C6CJ24_9BACT|nr:hypothetical protein Pla144_42400 [Bythopirellula polymerisocia]